MAKIKINDLQRATDMAILVLKHSSTNEEQHRRVPAAVIDKYRQHADGSRDFDLTDAWEETPGFDASWNLIAWFEGVESTDSDTGWLADGGDFYEQTNPEPYHVEDLFYILVPGEIEPREYSLIEFTITRDVKGVTVSPNPDGLTIKDGFLIY